MRMQRNALLLALPLDASRAPDVATKGDMPRSTATTRLTWARRPHWPPDAGSVGRVSIALALCEQASETSGDALVGSRNVAAS